ncbi:MAG: hypothetical protein AAF371_19055 [Pseudomonadota bacterium]
MFDTLPSAALIAQSCPDETAGATPVSRPTGRRRPRRLVEAARHCAQAMLRADKGPGAGETESCEAAEAACEFLRRSRPLGYSNRRHVEALARLLAAEARAAAGPAQV